MSKGGRKKTLSICLEKDKVSYYLGYPLLNSLYFIFYFLTWTFKMIISKICNFYVTLSSYINIGLFIELIHVIFELFLYDFLGYNKSQDKRI